MERPGLLNYNKWMNLAENGGHNEWVADWASISLYQKPERCFSSWDIRVALDCWCHGFTTTVYNFNKQTSHIPRLLGEIPFEATVSTHDELPRWLEVYRRVAFLVCMTWKGKCLAIKWLYYLHAEQSANYPAVRGTCRKRGVPTIPPQDGRVIRLREVYRKAQTWCLAQTSDIQVSSIQCIK